MLRTVYLDTIRLIVLLWLLNEVCETYCFCTVSYYHYSSTFRTFCINFVRHVLGNRTADPFEILLPSRLWCCKLISIVCEPVMILQIILYLVKIAIQTNIKSYHSIVTVFYIRWRWCIVCMHHLYLRRVLRDLRYQRGNQKL